MSTKRVVFSALLFALAGMVLVMFVIGFTLLPDRFDVRTERTFAAPVPRIAALLTDLKTWHDWASLDANLGPQTTLEIAGVPNTAGQVMRWSGQKGTATLRFTAVGDTGLEYEFSGVLADGRDYPWRGQGRIEWQPDGEQCRVTWRETLLWDTLAGRWVAWFGAQQQRVSQIQVSSLQGLAEAVATDAASPDSK